MAEGLGRAFGTLAGAEGEPHRIGAEMLALLRQVKPNARPGTAAH